MIVSLSLASSYLVNQEDFNHMHTYLCSTSWRAHSASIPHQIQKSTLLHARPRKQPLYVLYYIVQVVTQQLAILTETIWVYSISLRKATCIATITAWMYHTSSRRHVFVPQSLHLGYYKVYSTNHRSWKIQKNDVKAGMPSKPCLVLIRTSESFVSPSLGHVTLTLCSAKWICSCHSDTFSTSLVTLWYYLHVSIFHFLTFSVQVLFCLSCTLAKNFCGILL